MDDATIAPARHRLTVHEFDRMAEADVFGPEERIELIDGDLIDMAPIGQEHAANVSALTEALVIACAGRAIVWSQSPIQLDASNQPQPDHAILRRRADFYSRGERPHAAAVLLIVEVSDSSLRFDRAVKLPLYARCGIPELWIVNVPGRVMECHRGPVGDRYETVTEHHPNETIALAAAPDIVVTSQLFFASGA